MPEPEQCRSEEDRGKGRQPSQGQSEHHSAEQDLLVHRGAEGNLDQSSEQNLRRGGVGHPFVVEPTARSAGGPRPGRSPSRCQPPDRTLPQAGRESVRSEAHLVERGARGHAAPTVAAAPARCVPRWNRRGTTRWSTTWLIATPATIAASAYGGELGASSGRSHQCSRRHGRRAGSSGRTVRRRHSLSADGPHPLPTFDPSDEWFRRPDVWSGLVLAAWAATAVVRPVLDAPRHRAPGHGQRGRGGHGVCGRQRHLWRHRRAS